MEEGTRSMPPSQSRNIIVTELAPPSMRKREAWSIDQFDLTKKIGGGYASVVYLATCQTTGIQVALKVYQKSKLNDLTAFQIFREIRIHSRLDHKNILQLWAAFEDDYAIYMATEYASKGDVFCDVERRGGYMSEAETVQQVLHPFLQALVYLHERKIMHRDIKPENLLFTATGVLKVADFGLSIEFDRENPVTRVGTLDYMAPEVVVCPEKHNPNDNKEVKHLHYSPVVDSWAVGVLAYELCIGQPPFDRGHKKLTISEILYGDAKLPPSLSEQGGDFMCWALTKNKHMRPTVQRLLEHPWIASHMQPSVRGGGQGGRPFGRHMRFVESFGAAHRPQKQLQLLQKPAASVLVGSAGVAQGPPLAHGLPHRGGKVLGRSLSLGAADLVRRRNIDFDLDLDPAKLPARASMATPIKRRMSECAAEAATAEAPAAPAQAPVSGSAAAHAPSPLVRYQQHLSGGSRGAAAPLLLSPQPAPTREEVFARLQASAAKLNRSLSSRGGGGGLPPAAAPASQRSLPQGSAAAAAAAAAGATTPQTQTPVKAQLGPWSRSPRSARMQQKVHSESQGFQLTVHDLPSGFHRASEQAPSRSHSHAQALLPSLSSDVTDDQAQIHVASVHERAPHVSAPIRALRSSTAPHPTVNFAFRPQPPTSAHSRSSLPFSFPPSQPTAGSAYARSSMPFSFPQGQPAASSALLLLLPPSSLNPNPAPRPHSGPVYSSETLNLRAPQPSPCTPGPVSPPASHLASPPAQQASPTKQQRSSPRVHHPTHPAQQQSPAAQQAHPPALQVHPPALPSAPASHEPSPTSHRPSPHPHPASPAGSKPSSPASHAQTAAAGAPVAAPPASPAKPPSLLAQVPAAGADEAPVAIAPLASPVKPPSLLAQTFASIMGSRESSFTCSRKPVGTANPERSAGSRGFTSLVSPLKAGPVGASAKQEAVPMLLQSAKDMLGSLQKVFS